MICYFQEDLKFFIKVDIILWLSRLKLLDILQTLLYVDSANIVTFKIKVIWHIIDNVISLDIDFYLIYFVMSWPRDPVTWSY